jgi:hypothetical protein
MLKDLLMLKDKIPPYLMPNQIPVNLCAEKYVNQGAD